MCSRSLTSFATALALPLCASGCAVTSTTAAPAPRSASADAPSSPRHAEEGTWRISGGSNALFSTREFGPVDQTTFGLALTAGKIVSPNVLVEGIFEFSDSTTKTGAGGRVDETSFTLGAGLRYYFTLEGSTQPYARVLGGLSFVDVDVSGPGGGDDDLAPFLGIGIGAETFLSDQIALEYGFRVIHAFDLFDESQTDSAIFIGISVWL